MKIDDIPTVELCHILCATERDAGLDSIEARVLRQELTTRVSVSQRNARGNKIVSEVEWRETPIVDMPLATSTCRLLYIAGMKTIGDIIDFAVPAPERHPDRGGPLREIEGMDEVHLAVIYAAVQSLWEKYCKSQYPWGRPKDKKDKELII